MRIERNMTEAEALRKCLELARIDAIRSAFGDVIMQGNSTFIENKNSNHKVESQSVFNFYSDTYVNGEWIEDANPPTIDKLIRDNETWLNVSVKCRVRELKASVVNFKAKPTSCPDVKCSTSEFNEGQDFFLYFKSPVDGFLAVYLDVPYEGKTYRILPYKQYATEGNVVVKADEEYVFFSKNPSQKGRSSYVDEMILALSQTGIAETNKIFILFSPKEEIGKPMLSNTIENEIQKQLVRGGFELPSHLPSEEFQKWLQQIRSRNRQIEFLATYINIKP